MAGTTRKDLDQLVTVINNITRTADYHIEYAYDRPRLVRAGGSVDISPRLAAGEMKDWLHAFITGLITDRA